MTQFTIAQPKSRTDFIDRLRVVLTVLVIAHHTAITYGASGGWFYREIKDGGTASSLVLTVFASVNQAFFMGMFFLIAGYFTPASMRKKGAAAFVKERLIRLGIPLLVFGFLLGPLTSAIAQSAKGQGVMATWIELLAKARFEIGPLWFAFALLIFAAATVLWSAFKPFASEPDAAQPLPSWPAWLISALAVGAAALLLRQWMPVGESVWGLQFGYFASYVFLYALGCRAASGQWLERVSAGQAKTWGWIAMAAAPTLYIAAALSGALAGKAVSFSTGFGLPAVVYAFWEPLVAWGIIAVLLHKFRIRWHRPSAFWRQCSANAYGAFILHAPILVALCVWAAPWAAPALIKFAVIAAGATALSFSLAGLLRKLPGAHRVL